MFGVYVQNGGIYTTCRHAVLLLDKIVREFHEVLMIARRSYSVTENVVTQLLSGFRGSERE
jgi:hypothetical protein